MHVRGQLHGSSGRQGRGIDGSRVGVCGVNGQVSAGQCSLCLLGWAGVARALVPVGSSVVRLVVAGVAHAHEVRSGLVRLVITVRQAIQSGAPRRSQCLREALCSARVHHEWLGCAFVAEQERNVAGLAD
jgi:hypothetical protein